jgi:hypothetical protein
MLLFTRGLRPYVQSQLLSDSPREIQTYYFSSGWYHRDATRSSMMLLSLSPACSANSVLQVMGRPTSVTNEYKRCSSSSLRRPSLSLSTANGLNTHIQLFALEKMAFSRLLTLISIAMAAVSVVEATQAMHRPDNYKSPPRTFDVNTDPHVQQVHKRATGKTQFAYFTNWYAFK